MNPRAFCEEGSYPWALLLTYAIDPAFFERVVLRDLGRGGSNSVLVLADGGAVERSLRTPSPLIRSLGRSYLLEPAAVPGAGAFHPKLFLRIGAAGGLVWLGTGNLTHGGWGGNQELATAFRIGPESTDPGGWVAPLLRRVQAWTSGALAADVLGAMAALEWVRASDGLSDPPFLMSDTGPLSGQLERRWAGRRFDTLAVLTGSTDRSGEMLRWAQRAFGVRSARVALDPDRASFDMDGLAGLPLNLEIVPQKLPPFHAKLYWLDGPDGPAAVVGSPNCSASAWTRPAAANGNIETALVFDRPDPPAFVAALRPLAGDGSPPARHFPTVRPKRERDAAPAPYRLASLSWDAEAAEVEARFQPPAPPEAAIVALVLPGEIVPLVARAGGWTGPVPEAATLGHSVVGRVRVQLPDGAVHETPARWLDAPHLQRQAILGRRQASIVEGLFHPGTGRSDDQLIQELAALGHDLLTDGATFADPLRALASRRRERPAETTHVIDAERLIVALEDEVIPLGHPLEGGGGGAGLGGIYDAVFGSGDENDEAAWQPEPPDDENETSHAHGPRLERSEPPPAPSPAQVAERLRKRFAQHIDQFMTGLRGDKFAARCTATQLRQAIGYPVAACVLGRRRGWADEERSLGWIKGCVDLLLFGAEGGKPLLHVVAERYTGDRRKAFEQIVGDGVLWVLLASALVNVRWPGADGALHRAVLLAELWKADVLRGAASSDRIAALARRHRAEDAVAAIRDVAAPVSAAIATLEARLDAAWQRAKADGGLPQAGVTPGELLWGPRAGWLLAQDRERDEKVLAYWVREGRSEVKFRLNGALVAVAGLAGRDPLVAEAHERLLRVLRATLQPQDTPAAAGSV